MTDDDLRTRAREAAEAYAPMKRGLVSADTMGARWAYSDGYVAGYADGLRWGKRDGDRIAAETLRELHRVQAENQRLAATVARVRGMAVTAPPLMTKSGYVAGVVSASALLAAIEGTDS